MSTEQYIRRMREDMELRRLAEGAQWNYERVIWIFLKHSGKEVEELNEQDVRAYSLSLMKQRLQASTFNVYQAAIRFFFALAYGSGLRRSEICRLKVQDIDSKNMRVFVRNSKGGKDRYTVLSQSCSERLLAGIPPKAPGGVAVPWALKPYPHRFVDCQF